MQGSTLLPDTQHTSTGALLAGMLLCLWDLPVSMVGFIFECLTYPDVMRLQLALTRPIEFKKTFGWLHIRPDHEWQHRCFEKENQRFIYNVDPIRAEFSRLLAMSIVCFHIRFDLIRTNVSVVQKQRTKNKNRQSKKPSDVYRLEIKVVLKNGEFRVLLINELFERTDRGKRDPVYYIRKWLLGHCEEIKTITRSPLNVVTSGNATTSKLLDQLLQHFGACRITRSYSVLRI